MASKGKKRKSKSKQSRSKTATAKKTSNNQAKRSKKAVKKTQVKKKASSKKAPVHKQKAPGQRTQRFESTRDRNSAFSGLESGDLEGLSRTEQDDSESVDELLDEGNAFEAGVVSGVEEADSEDEREVHTHEVPEDDVPEEYLEDE